jgi:2-dehydropantoate 2-reductase
LNDKIYIIGSGAIGKALTAFLSEKKKEVILIRGSVDDQPLFKETIEVNLNDETKITAAVDVSTLSHFHTLDGLVILTNKSFGNEKLSAAIRQKVNGPIVILQNGLGVEQPFLEKNFSEIYRCVLYATSQIDSNRKLKFKPVSISPIGIIKGNESTLQYIVEEIGTSHFLFRAELNIQPFIWKKAIANSVFNSICPLLNVDNGIFYRNETSRSLARQIVAECVAVSKESGVTLSEEDVMNNLLLISKSSDGQLISTLQDINNKRETEIDTLNFEFSRIAEKTGRPELAIKTRLLGELIKLKSDLSRSL